MRELVDADDAREWSESNALIGQGWVRQVAWGIRQRMPEAEGLTPREWRRKYYGQLRVPVEALEDVASDLYDDGYSQREIADATGAGLGSVNRALNSVPVGTEDQPAEPLDQDADAASALTDVPAGTEDREDLPTGQDRADAILADIDQQVAEQAESAEPEPDNGDGLDDEPEPEPEKPRVEVKEGDEWYTPRWLFDALGIDKYAADVCAPPDLTHSSVPAEHHFTIEDDGLALPWPAGTVWCNPPYSKPEPWARRMIHHGDGLLLTHIPMNAGWCVDVWEACDGIRLFQAMEFVRPDGTTQRPGYWLQLAAFGPVARDALARLQPLGAAAANKRRVASPMWRRAA